MIEDDGDKELPAEDEGKNVVKDCEFKVETVNGNVQGRGVGTLQVKGSQVQQQEQSQEAVICWERFLHVTSIKVLLVENDDSTRHVVTALLRKCKYEVIQAANGLQAWKILENRTNQIDLVLSEVVMPCISGIGLLCKIMSHKTHKNIPVIMMSSHDSVGLVFKCLSKGAADFLVKPIRKNELKNLWQHVWRRCLSSSGSGSESGTQTQKSVKSKSGEQSGNNSANDDGEDNQGNDPLGNGSDDGSDTRSSWTKEAVEVDSSRAVSPCDQARECGDSPHEKNIRSIAETSANMEAHMNPSRDRQEEPGHKSALERDSNASSLKMDIEKENRIDNRPPSLHHVGTAEISHPQTDRRELVKVVDASEINNTSMDDSKHYVAELSLKRLRGLKESGLTFQDDRNVLRRSELSAFSRYNSSSDHTKTPNGTRRSSSIENTLEIAKINSVDNIEAHMNKKLLNPSSNGVSDNIAMGSTPNIHTSEPLPLRDTVNSLHLSSAFKPVASNCINSSQQTPQVEPGDMRTPDVLQTHKSQILNQHCTSNHDDLSLKRLGVDGPHCASSNILAGSREGNPDYPSSNKSASVSNHGSNRQNESSKAVNAGVANGNSDTGLAGTIRSGGDASGSDSGNTMDPFKLVRAAALAKFRQKRNERCFDKKVRYQNRKKLAEQRPRVRGQFVKQIGLSNSANATDELVKAIFSESCSQSFTCSKAEHFCEKLSHIET